MCCHLVPTFIHSRVFLILPLFWGTQEGKRKRKRKTSSTVCAPPDPLSQIWVNHWLSQKRVNGRSPERALTRGDDGPFWYPPWDLGKRPGFQSPQWKTRKSNSVNNFFKEKKNFKEKKQFWYFCFTFFSLKSHSLRKLGKYFVLLLSVIVIFKKLMFRTKMNGYPPKNK